MLLISERERGYVFRRLVVAYYISIITAACIGMGPCIQNQPARSKIDRLGGSTRTGLGMLAYSLIEGVYVHSKRSPPHSSRIAIASFPIHCWRASCCHYRLPYLDTLVKQGLPGNFVGQPRSGAVVGSRYTLGFWGDSGVVTESMHFYSFVQCITDGAIRLSKVSCYNII